MKTVARSLSEFDWNFSDLSPEELIPALLWEMNREYEAVDRNLVNAQAWLSGKLSEKKPPMRSNKRTGRPPRYNTNFSEADTARLRIMNDFSEFIPFHEFLWLHKGTPKQKRDEHIRWVASHIAPILEHCKMPWLCLPETQRQRLTKVYHNSRNAHIVSIEPWGEAIAYFKRHKIDPGLPLKFDFRGNYWDDTRVLLKIDWRHGKSRILKAIEKILKQLEPKDVKRLDRRGKKNRDLLVILERLAVMRLLHYHPLSEIKRLVPEAWRLYQNRKWYHDRRQALKDFRSVIGFREVEKFFPKSWRTKAQQSRKETELPGK